MVQRVQQISCPSRDQLEGLLSDTLDEADREKLELHLSSCVSCAQKFLDNFDADERWEKWESSLLGEAIAKESTLSANDNHTSETRAVEEPWRWHDKNQVETPNLPGYRIVREVGRGGMGVVYLARDERLKRDVAIKILLAGALAGPSRCQRVRNEAIVIARLEHPNIVRIHEVGETAGAPFLSLEFVAGTTLATYAATSKLSATDVAQLMTTVARAVQFAHDKGIVHRDLKPSNILLETIPASTGDSGATKLCPKITDFGLAKMMGDEDLTRTGELMGTPSYMAPELIHGNDDQRRAADVDIYALGAILYELLTGRPPFRSNSPWETVAKMSATDPLAPRAFDPTVPLDLETICLKSIHRNPLKRYASAAHFADDLQRFCRHRPIVARPASLSERSWKFAKRHPRGVSAALILLTAIIISLGFWFRFTQSLNAARLQAVQQAELAERHLEQAQVAVGHYLEQVSSDQRLGAQSLQPLRRSLIEEAIGVYSSIVTDDSDEGLILDYARAHSELGKMVTEEDSAFAKSCFRESIRLLSGPVTHHTDSAEIYSCMISAHISLGKSLEADGDFEASLASLSLAEELFDALQEKEANVELTCWRKAALCNTQGDLLNRLDRLGESQLKFEQSVVLTDQLPAIADFYWERAVSHANLGQVLARQGGDKRAEAELRLAMHIAQIVVQTARPVLVRYRHNLSERCIALASFLEDRSESSEKEVAHLYQQSIKQQLRMIRDFPKRREDFKESRTAIGKAADDFFRRRGQFDPLEQLQRRLTEDTTRPEWLCAARTLLNEGYRKLEYSCDNQNAAKYFADALEQLVAERPRDVSDVDIHEANEFACIAHERLALSQLRMGQYRACVKNIEAALSLAAQPYVNLDQLNLLKARANARIGQYHVAESTLDSVRDIPPEMQCYQAQVLLLCAAAAIDKDEIVAQRCWKDLQELDRLWNRLPVSRMEFGMYPRAKYHATWVDVGPQLGKLLNGDAVATIQRHKLNTLQLLESLCRTNSSAGLREAIRGDVQFDSVRGKELDKILND